MIPLECSWGLLFERYGVAFFSSAGEWRAGRALSSDRHLVTDGRQPGDKAEGRAESSTDKQSWSLGSHSSEHFRSLSLQRPGTQLYLQWAHSRFLWSCWLCPSWHNLAQLESDDWNPSNLCWPGQTVHSGIVLTRGKPMEIKCSGIKQRKDNNLHLTSVSLGKSLHSQLHLRWQIQVPFQWAQESNILCLVNSNKGYKSNPATCFIKEWFMLAWGPEGYKLKFERHEWVWITKLIKHFLLGISLCRLCAT